MNSYSLTELQTYPESLDDIQRLGSWFVVLLTILKALAEPERVLSLITSSCTLLLRLIVCYQRRNNTIQCRALSRSVGRLNKGARSRQQHYNVDCQVQSPGPDKTQFTLIGMIVLPNAVRVRSKEVLVCCLRAGLLQDM